MVATKIKNKWIHHVSGQAKKLGIKYSEAMKDPRVKASYYEAHGLKRKKPF